MPRNALLALLIITVILGLAHIAYYHPKLPEEVATHFNGRGEADGFGSKQFHSWMMVGLQVGVAAMFVGLGYLITVLPTSLINMPNKEYWLAEERKNDSLGKIRSGLLVMGVGTQVFFVALNHLITLHNLGQPAMNWFWPLLGVFLVFTIGFCIWISMQFRLPADH